MIAQKKMPNGKTFEKCAENEEKAKLYAIEMFKNSKDKIFKRNIDLQDDNYGVNGILDMDSTWNMVQS